MRAANRGKGKEKAELEKKGKGGAGGAGRRQGAGGAGDKRKTAGAAPAAPPTIRTKGVRVSRAKSDGLRVLVTRHAPHKVKKEAYDMWCVDLAPGSALLRRYRRGEISRDGFGREYMHELRTSEAARCAAREIQKEAAAARRQGRVTLLFDMQGRDGVRRHDGKGGRPDPDYHRSLCGIVRDPGQFWAEAPAEPAPGAERSPSAESVAALRARLTESEMDLRSQIIQHMKEGGFAVNPHLRLPRHTGESYRRVQKKAKEEQVRASRAFLLRALDAARGSCRDGAEIDPEKISLEIREVRAGEPEADLFRWWNLVWWSMPYQRAYGRQMRLLLWDKAHDAPFGLVSLQSPLLRMGVRDRHLGINRDNAETYANMSMSAQRVGALPPYNGLIGGKMAALAMTSDEVRAMYRKKYEGRITVMERRVLDPELLFITTTSAFGASSMYDRLTYENGLAAVPIGFTSGAGTFHLPGELTRRMYRLMEEEHGTNTKTTYGNGPSRKLRLFKESFRRLGLGGFHLHGIRRQVYLFPLASNLPGVIEKGDKPQWIERPLSAAEGYWRKRWAIPRSRRAAGWRSFKASEYFDGVAKLLGPA